VWNELVEAVAMAVLDVLLEAPRIAHDGISTKGAILKFCFPTHDSFIESVKTCDI
jgi:hypothetical protein